MKQTKLQRELADLSALIEGRESFDLPQVKAEMSKIDYKRVVEDMEIRLLDQMDVVYKILEKRKFK